MAMQLPFLARSYSPDNGTTTDGMYCPDLKWTDVGAGGNSTLMNGRAARTFSTWRSTAGAWQLGIFPVVGVGALDCLFTVEWYWNYTDNPNPPGALVGGWMESHLNAGAIAGAVQRITPYQIDYGPIVTLTKHAFWIPNSAHWWRIGAYSDGAVAAGASFTVHVTLAVPGSTKQAGNS